MNKILTLEQMKRMSIDEIVDSYRNEYRLSCKTCEEGNISRLSPASCPTSIIQGTTKILTAAVTTQGTPPYTPKFYVDGIQKIIVSTWDSANNRFTFSWTFDETVANHTYAIEVVDSCATGVKTSNRDVCTINIVAPCLNPTVVLTIPS